MDTDLSSLSEESDREEEPRYRRIRFIRPRINAFEKYDDVDFKARFRFRKDIVLNILARIGNYLEPKVHGNRSIEPMSQLLLTLRFYATGAFQNCIGDNVNISQPSVSRIIKRVTHYIALLGQEEIKMPSTQEEIIEVCTQFYTIRNFPRVIGAVDCTHIKILSPGGRDAELYRNRKGYFSLNIQVVCDAHLKIRHIISRWPGSVHDSTILNDSPLVVNLTRGRYGRNNFLLGDSGYPCKTYLLTPVLNPRTPAEEEYNRAQIATRNTVERCFGVLKRRFACLSVGLRTHVDTTAAVIVACAVLHNIAIDLGDFFADDPDEYLQIIENNDVAPIRQHNVNTTVRNAIIEGYFT